MKKVGFRLYGIGWPFSVVYGFVVKLRNLFFDWRLLPSVCYPIPVICVGNLAVGGTGKTPVVEYLLGLLGADYRVAVLSRGYKRKSSGFVLAEEGSTAVDIGDEPYQIKHKFPNVAVAVDANRRRGMDELLALPEDMRPQVILLDDGFQHRYVKPSMSIIVSDVNRLYYKDRLMPFGRLREPAASVRRADAVIVSKCKDVLKLTESQVIESEMGLRDDQRSFFTSIVYGQMVGVYPEGFSSRTLQSIKKNEGVLIVTGIANPRLFIDEVTRTADRVRVLSFPDHHDFTKGDIGTISTELERLGTDRFLILCTEKDAARMRNCSFFPEIWRSCIYYIPMVVNFLFDKEKGFNRMIRRHIEGFFINNGI